MPDTIKKLKFPTQNPKVWAMDNENNIPPHLLSDEIITALKVAVATERPLLISGESGCGKATIAKAMAHIQGWGYVKYSFTANSCLEDLTGEVDQEKRIHDANVQRLNEEWTYLQPGPFWWGFNPTSALKRGRGDEDIGRVSSRGMSYTKPNKPESLKPDCEGVVILLDGIEKTEINLPGDLLEPLNQRRFQLKDGTKVRAPKGSVVLTIITTNNERDLPLSFLRKSIHLALERPDAKRLVAIATFYLGDRQDDLYRSLADRLIVLSNDVPEGEHKPGTSEYLDAIQACSKLGITPDDNHPVWQQIEQATLRKYSNCMRSKNSTASSDRLTVVGR